MPNAFEPTKKEGPSREEMQAADKVAKQLADEMSIDSLLKEFGDGEY